MTSTALTTLTASVLAVLAHGCTGYADGSGRTPDSQRSRTPVPASREPRGTPEASAGTESPPQPETPAREPEPPQPTAADPDGVERDANLHLTNTPRFGAHLTDDLGQALYMFVGDVSGAELTACLDECARDWPAFDVELIHPGRGLDRAELARFHRQDGAWQTTYKGYPLYRRADEAPAVEPSHDADGQRWFLARDYLAFMSAARNFAPAGGSATDGAFLTDGFGRTLYVCLDDTPSSGAVDAASSCDADCARERPVFPSAATERSSLLPKAIDPRALGELAREDGTRQLTYRGWPLYYYDGDTTPGETQGHNERAWRAIDPTGFGLEPTTDASL